MNRPKFIIVLLINFGFLCIIIPINLFTISPTVSSIIDDNNLFGIEIIGSYYQS